MDCGFSGVMLRGSGVAWDLRKSQPYAGYEKFDFDIPVGKNGDCFDRSLCRIEEMRKSARIVRQVIEPLPGGPISSDDRKVVPPARGALKRSTAELIPHFTPSTPGQHVPEGEAYAAVETPTGE